MFPLGTAVLPGGEVPLRVFEPRYRQMVGDLMAESDGRPVVRFGVVLILSLIHISEPTRPY